MERLIRCCRESLFAQSSPLHQWPIAHGLLLATYGILGISLMEAMALYNENGPYGASTVHLQCL